MDMAPTWGTQKDNFATLVPNDTKLIQLCNFSGQEFEPQPSIRNTGLSVWDHGFHMILYQAPTHDLFLIEVRSHLTSVGNLQPGTKGDMCEHQRNQLDQIHCCGDILHIPYLSIILLFQHLIVSLRLGAI